MRRRGGKGGGGGELIQAFQSFRWSKVGFMVAWLNAMWILFLLCLLRSICSDLFGGAFFSGRKKPGRPIPSGYPKEEKSPHQKSGLPARRQKQPKTKREKTFESGRSKQAASKQTHDLHGRPPELHQLPLQVRVLVIFHQKLSPQDGHL